MTGRELVAALAEDAAARLERYARIDTQSDEDSLTFPSTAKQWDLLRLLHDELRELGLEDVTIDDHGYVFATVPATVEHDVRTIGFLAHVDTSPDYSGTGVRPRRVVYEGGDGPGKGKHIVLVSGDEEYRSEEALQIGRAHV